MQQNGRVLIATDHGGIDLKNNLVAFLKSKNVNVHDLGPFDKTSVCYSIYSKKIVEQLKEQDRAIAICSTGMGISFGIIKSGIKCSLAFNEMTARGCRELGMQVMAMGGHVITLENAKRMLKQFLDITN